ncbi:DUF1361 domain-containing protein [Paenibacillus sp. ACRRX]|uniref:DUF1361 domain-containing protein n=1 Tax=Paenibacillus sp. ACRRX TaxID=2918206 RepID=UPI001EF6CE90|nr:DUF1361 domain-containing protein [Paenibacillus sp. ACRRX]MCG7406860.1 DUF1361 domain-containing protein [Paenibacillus sp. ACRRX]
MERQFSNKTSVIPFTAIILLYFIWITAFERGGQGYMIWNVILAAIPFYASILLYRSQGWVKRSKFSLLGKVYTGGLAVIWFLFYPNAPYVVTDMIHIQSEKFIIKNPDYVPYMGQPRILFNSDMALWSNFYTIAIGVFIAVILSFVSMYVLQQLIAKRWNRQLSWLLVALMQLLSGFAIYLGRFIRWNSWDLITEPSNLWTILTRDLHMESIQFAILSGTTHMIIYLMLYLLVNRLSVGR